MDTFSNPTIPTRYIILIWFIHSIRFRPWSLRFGWKHCHILPNRHCYSLQAAYWDSLNVTPKICSTFFFTVHCTCLPVPNKPKFICPRTSNFRLLCMHTEYKTYCNIFADVI
jgi:hypothetical protein